MDEAKEVPGFPGYKCTKDGKVFSCRWGTSRHGEPKEEKWRELKQSRSSQSPYRAVTLCKDTKKLRYPIHKIVLLAFVGPRPEGMVTRHLDGDPLNNHLDNLTYGTQSENHIDRIKHGRGPVGGNHHLATLCAEQVESGRILRDLGWSWVKINRAIGRSGSITAIRKAVTGQSWKHL